MELATCNTEVGSRTSKDELYGCLLGGFERDLGAFYTKLNLLAQKIHNLIAKSRRNCNELTSQRGPFPLEVQEWARFVFFESATTDHRKRIPKWLPKAWKIDPNGAKELHFVAFRRFWKYNVRCVFGLDRSTSKIRESFPRVPLGVPERCRNGSLAHPGPSQVHF